MCGKMNMMNRRALGGSCCLCDDASGDVVSDMPWVVARYNVFIMRTLQKMTVVLDKLDGMKYSSARKLMWETPRIKGQMSMRCW